MKIERVDLGASPVSLIEVKEHLRLTGDDFDNSLKLYIEAATSAAEKFTGLVLHESEYKITTGWSTEIRTGIMPIRTVSVKVNDIVIPDVYFVDSTVFLPGEDQADTVEITIHTGFDVFPADIKAAILLMVGKLFENPSDSVETLPKASTNLLRAHRKWGR